MLFSYALITAILRIAAARKERQPDQGPMDQRATPEDWKDSSVLVRDSVLSINAPKLLNDLK
jgi:hypothetical protein